MSKIDLATKGILSGRKEAVSGDVSLQGTSSGTSTVQGEAGYITNLSGSSSGISSTTILLQVFTKLQESPTVEITYGIVTNLFGQAGSTVEVEDCRISIEVEDQEVEVEVEPVAVFVELLET